MRVTALGLAWIGAVAAIVYSRGCPATPAGERDPCTRPAVGSEVPEPEDLRSRDGVLKLRLTLRNHREGDGSIRYCYLLGDGAQAPTLRLRPGDTLVLTLENRLSDLGAPGAMPPASSPMHGKGAARECAGGAMSLISTNLHFHGLTVPPVCHQDDVLNTLVQPGDAPFDYRIRIPPDEPPGLYWYHPHVHGFSTKQVLGGASGALIVEGIERVEPQISGLPERVLVIRDQELMNPDAPPSKDEPVVPKMFIDRDGDAANNGTGFGKPAKDLSINYVPVPYPDYPPATITMRPGERQLWRVIFSSTKTVE